MSTPPPLREGQGPLAEALRATATAEPRGEQAMRERVWRRLSEKPRRSLRPAFAAAALAAVASVAVIVFARRPAPLAVVDSAGYEVLENGALRVALAPGAVLRELRLERGMAAFEVRQLLRIAAGAAFVEASSASFVAEVQARRVVVRAEEGALRIESGGRTVELSPGGVWSSEGEPPKQDEAADALRDLLKAAPGPARAQQLARFTAAREREAQEELDRRAQAAEPAEAAELYAQLAQGDGPRAANALYELAQLRLRRLGQPAAALEAIDEYRRRFPDGALAQEAALTAIEARLSLGQEAQAAREMDAFLARYPDSERAAEVRRLRAAAQHPR